MNIIKYNTINLVPTSYPSAKKSESFGIYDAFFNVSSKKWLFLTRVV